MPQKPPSFEIIQFPCLDDNYGYLVHDHTSSLTAAIDAPDATAILQQLQQHRWPLDFILNTHHHADHIGGNLELKAITGCMIVGPRAEQARIPGLDIAIEEGRPFELGNQPIMIYDTPGHTHGHIVYHFTAAEVAFVGDTLFSLGCGRLFEGTAQQMWNSLQKLLQWPDNTLIYCAHEYTEVNARFALTLEPDNLELQQRITEIKQLRAQKKPTIPTSIALEKRTNPFLRPQSLSIQNHLDMRDASALDIFTEIRRRKDITAYFKE